MRAHASQEYYEFAGFRLFPNQRTLLRDGEVVPIGGRAFDVLLLLVSRAGAIVSLNELMHFVWPSVTVEEANLRVQMGLLRKILARCEEARRAIETIPLRGYCFILPVHHASGAVDDRAQPLPAPSSLPVIPHSVIGQEQAIVDVAAALEERQLVTITGPAGVGKTTVAIKAAGIATAKRQRRVVYVDLSAVSEDTKAISAIAEVLGLPPTSDPVVDLRSELSTRDMILILDTCEHILQPIAFLAEMLAAHCPDLTLLATSCEALRAAGEWVHRLAPLPVPDDVSLLNGRTIIDFEAVALFLDRARSVARFDVGPQELPVIADICRRLDGIPLAIELAATRIADLGLRGIAAQLDQRFAVLTRGRRTAPPRHQTLSAAWQWSLGLLSEIERRTLRQLASLPGPFTAQDALNCFEQAGHEPPPDALPKLYEKSLLSVDLNGEAPIYRLFDTTRVYVADFVTD